MAQLPVQISIVDSYGKPTQPFVSYLISTDLTNNIKSTTSSITASNKDYIVANASSGAITITMPKASQSKGSIVSITKADSSANNVTIARQGTDLISGSTSATLSSIGSYITLICDGINWWRK